MSGSPSPPSPPTSSPSPAPAARTPAADVAHRQASTTTQTTTPLLHHHHHHPQHHLTPPPVAAAASPAPASTPPPAASSSPRPERKLARNVSPGLLARMKFLNQGNDTDSTRNSPASIGRISEHKIRELDDFHKDRSFGVRIERRGTAWSGVSSSGAPSQLSTPLLPQLTGDSVPALAMDHSPPPGFDSDRSSFVSTSDRVLPSDSEAGDALHPDTQKYRLPDLTKSKSLAPTPDTSASTETLSPRAPTPPPKDAPKQAPGTPQGPRHVPPQDPAEEPSVLDDNDGIDIAAYFHRRQFSRATSIYTLSRASFTNQIQQLTSISLPPAASLSSSISAIPTSTAAGRALHEAANQIKLWMAKATEVLDGLDAEDDVEWAAAAGREGLAEVDAAIGKFEGLVTVYITAIEDLQSRPDIASLPSRDLTRLVTQMEQVVGSWGRIKKSLKSIKSQVEIAMEWEELWNTVLGEIGLEIENLTRLVFEMEERRHRAITDSVAESAEKFDIADLETIVEETPRQQARMQNKRFSMGPALTVMSPISPIPQIEQESSRLLALFAKLQPLRASLDFLPMRLSSFEHRASKIFPSACDELTQRRVVLEKQEKKLEADADALREELGEDKWVHSFRQAGSKAVAMYDSLLKSIQRLCQAIEENDEDKIGSRISSYKDKREHYPPSMRRVLQLIDIEMKNRSTVNGEILRIQQDVRQKVSDLEEQIQDTDALLEDFSSTRKLRDSVSTVLSSRTEQSLTSSALDTPNSSPASSIIMTGRKSSDRSLTTPVKKSSRQSSVASAKSSLPASRRYSSLPTATASVPRKALTASRLENIPSSMGPSRAKSSTPTSARSTSTVNSSKPRWNASVNMRDTVVGHNFKPLTLTTPSPHRKDGPPRSLRSVSSHSAIPVRSPLGRSSALSPGPADRPASVTPGAKRPTASTLQSPFTPSRVKSAMAMTPPTGTPPSARHVSIAEEDDEAESSPSARRVSRPQSAMTSRRVSMLPTPKQRTVSGSSISSTTPGRSTSRLGSIDEGRKSRIGSDAGRTSRVGGRKSVIGMTEEKPRWRG